MADAAESELQFSEGEAASAPPPPPGETPAERQRRASRRAWVLVGIAAALFVWFIIVLVGDAENWRGRGEEWAGLETGQWVVLVGALLAVILVIEVVWLARRLTYRSGAYLKPGEGSEEEPVVTAEAEPPR